MNKKHSWLLSGVWGCLIYGLFISPMHAVTFDGHMEKKIYSPDGNVVQVQSNWVFHVEISGNDYSIECDNTETQQQTILTRVKDESFMVTEALQGVFTASASDQEFPRGIHESVQVLWLAFCSGNYFKAQGNAQLPLWNLIANNFEVTNTTVVTRGKLGLEKTPLPKQISIYLNKPNEQLQPSTLRHRYEAESTTVIDGISWPSLFLFSTCVSLRNVSQPDDVRMGAEMVFHVDASSSDQPKISLPNPNRDRMPTNLKIVDHRFNNTITPFAHFLVLPGTTNLDWAQSNTLRYAQLRKEATEEDRYELASAEKTYSWKHKYRHIVITLFLIVILAPLPLYHMVQRSNQKKKHQKK